MKPFLEWLDRCIIASQSLGDPWALTVICLAIVLLGWKAGVFLTAATASIAAWRGGADPWRMFGSVFWDACTTAVFYGLLTLVVLRWDQYWLTVPAAVLVAFLVLITLVVTAEVVFGAVPLVVMKPRQVLSILATVGTRLGSDCLSIIYLALMLRAVMR
ncbi:MAG: hypothetical protein DMD77_05430 [Candidatus Rokuibacteriota bacterium]|nr:MAG: hypothetical protein DMD77_05430 [Candidatus Rokubacteria bacterium]